MDSIKDVSKLVFIKSRGGQFRWLTISTLMLAIGMILHLVSPSLAGFTPDWMIATYVVAILLTKPTYRQCIGICMVAAMMAVFTSKSAFPYGNFASEFVASFVIAFFVHSVPAMKIGKFDLKPIVAGFITTCVSGFVFVSILTLVMGVPQKVYLYGMIPAVALVGVGNALITPFLYYPALKLFMVSDGTIDENVKDSDHNRLCLKQAREGVISVENFGFTYPLADKKALRDINLNVKKGDFLVVTGPNGAGKTTLLMAMAGAVPHYYGGTMTGMVFTNGKATTQTSISDLASGVGVILADYTAQIVTLTVGEEMAFALENHGFSADEIRRRSSRALAKVHLDGLENRKVATLSGGQRQRLVVAAVLAQEPEVLLFDEPTSSFDPEGIREFYEMVGELNRKEGLTVVVAEHHLEATLPYATRFVLLDHGEILCDGTPGEVLRYMDSKNIYAEAIPDMYRAQLTLEKAGISFEKSFFNIKDAEVAVDRAFKGGHKNVGA